MADDRTAGIAVRGAIPLAAERAESPERVRQLAHEFEAMFLTQMLRQMRQSLAIVNDEEEPGFGKAAFTEQFDTELARHLSATGGLGIADVIIEAYDRQQAAQSPDRLEVPVGARDLEARPDLSGTRTLLAPGHGSRETPEDHSAATGVEGPSGAAVPLPLADPISSRFGWRADPFGGQGRFHRGIDVKAAYGQSVPTVADGNVVFAGPQGGYGLTVVVEHETGIQTRYAHLSELGVRAGEAVQQGQDLGRVGSTGRSTGPHLHFEVLEHGRAVDPVQAAARYAKTSGFKKLQAVADSSGGWPPAGPAAEE